MTVATAPVSQSSLVQRCMAQVIADSLASGTPIASMYLPNLEAIVISVLSQVSVDSTVAPTGASTPTLSAPDQATVAAHVKLAKADPK